MIVKKPSTAYGRKLFVITGKPPARAWIRWLERGRLEVGEVAADDGG
jgi:hypothetical protein